MKSYEPQLETNLDQYAADAELLLRVNMALSSRQQTGRGQVRVRAHNGIVKVEGSVPTYYDRQVIVAVVRHVAGVFRVEDELTLDRAGGGKSESRKRNTGLPEKAVARREEGITRPFDGLPVVSESLEDLLATRNLACQ